MLTPAFTKLQRSILTSSIWLEDMPTRLVWITLLALCDRDGIARCSPLGLAHQARVEPADCDAALAKLAAPDPDSRDMGDGRRIERVPGGFFVINYGEKLVEGQRENRRAYDAEWKRKKRAADKAETIRAPGTKKNGPKRERGTPRVYSDEGSAAHRLARQNGHEPADVHAIEEQLNGELGERSE